MRMAARKQKYKVTYSKVELRIPTAQKKRLKAYCKACNTTLNKVYRKVIRDFINHHTHPSGHKPQDIIENQMTIFDVCEEPIETYDIDKG
jgi:predicted HNH restriction endonuclease